MDEDDSGDDDMTAIGSKAADEEVIRN